MRFSMKAVCKTGTDNRRYLWLNYLVVSVVSASFMENPPGAVPSVRRALL